MLNNVKLFRVLKKIKFRNYESLKSMNLHGVLFKQKTNSYVTILFCVE